MKVKITNQLSNGEVIRTEHIIESGNVRIVMGDYTYYIDDSIPNDAILVRELTEDIETDYQYDNTEYPIWNKQNN
jgi:hypothetical protein